MDLVESTGVVVSLAESPLTVQGRAQAWMDARAVFRRSVTTIQFWLDLRVVVVVVGSL